jgi:hypothetical protein
MLGFLHCTRQGEPPKVTNLANSQYNSVTISEMLLIVSSLTVLINVTSLILSVVLFCLKQPVESL